MVFIHYEITVLSPVAMGNVCYILIKVLIINYTSTGVRRVDH